MGFYRDQAQALAKELRERRPGWIVEAWRDYGFAVDVAHGGRAVTACQPGRDDIGQAEVFHSADEVIAKIEGIS